MGATRSCIKSQPFIITIMHANHRSSHTNKKKKEKKWTNYIEINIHINTYIYHQPIVITQTQNQRKKKTNVFSEFVPSFSSYIRQTIMFSQ